MHASGRPEATAEAARTIHDQLWQVREGAVTSSEIARARRLIEAGWLRRMESADGQANFLGAWELAGRWEDGVAYHQAVLTANAARLTAVARKWLSPDAMSIVAYRPRGTSPLGADAAAVRAMLDAPGIVPLDPSPPASPVPALHPARATHVRTVDGVHLFRTERGVPILVRPRPGAALTHLGCFIAGGVVQESEAQGGISTLMARTMVRGTARRTATQLAEDAERLGGIPASSVGTEAMQWTMGVPAAGIGDAAELLADLILSPSFPADGLEAERAVAIASLASLRDDMYRQPMRLAADATWPGHPYGRSTIGTEESVRAMTADALCAWHQAHVLRGCTALAMVGDVDPQEAADLLAARFAGLEIAPRPEIVSPSWPRTGETRVDQREKAQTALAMFFEGTNRNDPARFAAEMLSGVASGLGGRFFELELIGRRPAGGQSGRA